MFCFVICPGNVEFVFANQAFFEMVNGILLNIVALRALPCYDDYMKFWINAIIFIYEYTFLFVAWPTPMC